MSKTCIFCNAPILSDYAVNVYWVVKRLKETTVKEVSKELGITIQQTNNYLSLLCQLNLLNRKRMGKVFIYFWQKPEFRAKKNNP